MTAVNIRLGDALKADACAYAKALGISLNALVAVAVRDYLDARKRDRVMPSSVGRAGAVAPVGARAPARPVGAAPSVSSSVGRPVAASGMTYKAGRNDLCPCGSGQKFKRCHGA